MHKENYAKPITLNKYMLVIKWISMADLGKFDRGGGGQITRNILTLTATMLLKQVWPGPGVGCMASLPAPSIGLLLADIE